MTMSVLAMFAPTQFRTQFSLISSDTEACYDRALEHAFCVHSAVYAVASSTPSAYPVLYTSTHTQTVPYIFLAGRVIMGMKLLREMSEVETLNQRPVVDCTVTKCGQLTPAEFATIACK